MTTRAAISQSLPLALLAGTALAQVAEPAPDAITQPSPAPSTDKSEYHLFNPTPKELWRPLSADRPDATESPYTVDAGAFQLEMTFFEFGTRKEDGETLNSFAVAPINFKIGVTNSADLQILFDPFLSSETPGGEDADGIGNFGLRWKQNLWGNDEGPVGVAIMPYITFPTGDDEVASDEVEGGVIVPVAIELPNGWGLGLQAELGFVDEDGDREEVFSHTAVLGRELFENVGGYIEYIGQHDLDGEYDSFLSGGLTYSLSADMQLDVGAVVGLNGDEDVAIFTGITVRF